MLALVATPIGNLGDMAPRAVEALRAASVIACEDTRRTWALLSHFGIPRPAEMISYREGNEERAGARILDLLRADRRVDAEILLQRLHADLQMQFAHAPHQGLAGFSVDAHPQRRIAA